MQLIRSDRSPPSDRANAGRAGAVLTKATLRAAEFLGLNNAALALTVGLSESSISRMASGSKTFDLGTKPAELATLLVRVYRSLDALVGNSDPHRLAWMSTYNHALNTTPKHALLSAEGLVRVVTYLDGARALA